MALLGHTSLLIFKKIDLWVGLSCFVIGQILYQVKVNLETQGITCSSCLWISLNYDDCTIFSEELHGHVWCKNDNPKMV